MSVFASRLSALRGYLSSTQSIPAQSPPVEALKSAPLSAPQDLIIDTGHGKTWASGGVLTDGIPKGARVLFGPKIETRTTQIPGDGYLTWWEPPNPPAADTWATNNELMNELMNAAEHGEAQIAYTPGKGSMFTHAEKIVLRHRGFVEADVLTDGVFKLTPPETMQVQGDNFVVLDAPKPVTMPPRPHPPGFFKGYGTESPSLHLSAPDRLERLTQVAKLVGCTLGVALVVEPVKNKLVDKFGPCEKDHPYRKEAVSFAADCAALTVEQSVAAYLVLGSAAAVAPWTAGGLAATATGVVAAKVAVKGGKWAIERMRQLPTLPPGSVPPMPQGFDLFTDA